MNRFIYSISGMLMGFLIGYFVNYKQKETEANRFAAALKHEQSSHDNTRRQLENVLFQIEEGRRLAEESYAHAQQQYEQVLKETKAKEAKSK